MSEPKRWDKPYPLLCVRRKDVAPGTVIPVGVATVRCDGCGAKVLAAASSRRHMAEGLVRPVCKACLPAGPVVPVMTAEQAADYASFTLPDPENN